MATNVMTAAGRKSNRRALLLAVVFGAISAVLVLSYLKDARSGKNENVVTAAAVFAVRDIPERTPVKEGMIEVRQIPVDARHMLAVSEKSQAVGQITRVPIAAGEQVLTSKIADQVRDVGFSATVPEGKRGVAVGVTEVIASGGHIAPGDTVDVIGLFEVYTPKDQQGGPSSKLDTAGKDQSDRPKLFTAVTILQNVQVLAVAKNADQNLQTGGDKSEKRTQKSDEAKSVTLALTPEQAEKVFLAEETGKLRLSLRPFGETEVRKIAPTTNSIAELVRP